ncbi:hypothetical protein ABB37_01996 [Leptomonas pyrrhocoris]|uniref:Transcription and mRNA export factor ENY2 n=1 Tax=Leptomonas pyrrhocoris TaxID=157538 RepID=A0A0N1J567_LEPPY|nr:hypothetical protein ABB37_01996 [Leptomonas pyrrhocoris]KPA83764.1 hypothetical protein ABB37_01996 [Leptomonas pyrrhocoris]|eukprot:XP_015662203.1 hypothetical protein ABB37_01996 [Leptomonas pyrrhocoris]
MNSAASSGHVAYEAMTNAQKAELSAYLRNQLTEDSNGPQWTSHMRLLIKETLARRAESGESVDAGDIVAEVLPVVRAAIPGDVREGLFRIVATQLNT